MKEKKITITFSEEWFNDAPPLAGEPLVDDTKDHSTDKTKKKYRLTDYTIKDNGRVLHCIMALRDFGDVTQGDLGGFIESEDNLSQEGNCWVYDDAKVYDNAIVCDNAQIRNMAKIYNDARVFCNAKVCGFAKIYNNSEVSGNAAVRNYAEICGNAHIDDFATIYDNAKICGDARIFEHAAIGGKSIVSDKVRIFGNPEIIGDAIIRFREDYIVFKNWWSSGRYFTWTKSNNMWKVGCFYGTGQELINRAYRDNQIKGYEYRRIVNYVQDTLGLPHIEPN